MSHFIRRFRDRAVGSVVLLALAACSQSTTLTDAGPGADSSVPPPDAGPFVPDAGPVDVDAGPAPDAGPPPVCGPDVRRVPAVYYGTTMPTQLPLTPGQVLALVDFSTCSGTFVTDEWVLTATHCTLAVGARLCVGPNPLAADVCFTVDRVEDNPSADQTLVHVDAPASSRIPELQPIPVMTELIDATWIGRITEAGGYGTQETGASGEREFTAEPIAAMSGNFVTVDGLGTHGLCFGDSGGPLMVLASDATVRVLGDLSNGDSSCVGQDNFTRTDLQIAWIESIIGPVVVTGAPCGRTTVEGVCAGASTAVWCDTATGLLTSEACAGGTTCGWDVATAAYRCVASDPCGGVSAAGACQGTTAVWCDAGTVRRQECGACAQQCTFVAAVSGYYCQPDPCAGIDPAGVCDGTNLVTCDPVAGVTTEDCAARGRVCGYSARRGGNGCIRP
jgi:hypothetical protein